MGMGLISIFGSQWITSAGTDVEKNHLSSPPVSQPGLLKQQLLFLHLLFLAQDKKGQGYCGIPLFVGGSMLEDFVGYPYPEIMYP